MPDRPVRRQAAGAGEAVAVVRPPASPARFGPPRPLRAGRRPADEGGCDPRRPAMLSRRTFLGIAVGLGSGGIARADGVTLAESPREGDCFRVTTATQVNGVLKVTRDGKPTALKIAATNEHSFAERVLAADKV